MATPFVPGLPAAGAGLKRFHAGRGRRREDRVGLVPGQHHHGRGPDTGGTVKVIIATDGTDIAIAAARDALRLLHPDASIELVTVVAARPRPEDDAGGFAGPIMTEEEADEDWQEAVRAGREALSRTIDALDIRVDEAKLVPSEASVDQALVALAHEERPDLLVLGSNERGWFDRLLHGSTDQHLLHDAPCPLLIVAGDQFR